MFKKISLLRLSLLILITSSHFNLATYGWLTKGSLSWINNFSLNKKEEKKKNKINRQKRIKLRLLSTIITLTLMIILTIICDKYHKKWTDKFSLKIYNKDITIYKNYLWELVHLVLIIFLTVTDLSNQLLGLEVINKKNEPVGGLILIFRGIIKYPYFFLAVLLRDKMKLFFSAFSILILNCLGLFTEEHDFLHSILTETKVKIKSAEH